jgi:hypothetical protein
LEPTPLQSGQFTWLPTGEIQVTNAGVYLIYYHVTTELQGSAALSINGGPAIVSSVYSIRNFPSQINGSVILNLTAGSRIAIINNNATQSTNTTNTNKPAMYAPDTTEMVILRLQ